jgi:SAM-dependent methyltransferase
MNEGKYQDVIKANIAVHSQIASVYAKTEPHYRPENVADVRASLERVQKATNGKSMLDLGCGAGFMIDIGKTMFQRIVGVDVTKAMLDKIDRSGPAKIEIHEHDTGTFPAEPGAFDVVTAYSFLHHLYDVRPTFGTAAKALKKGGQFFADLDPNFYFWDAVAKLEHKGTYDPIVQREIDHVAHKDDQMAAEHGIPTAVFNDAEYGKEIKGGFKEEELREWLLAAGFSSVTFRYYWFLGQAFMVNDERRPREARLEAAQLADEVLQKAMPLSRQLYKYLGFIATK